MEAMKSSPYKVTKRQILQVNIRKSCDDIVKYVYAQHRDKRGKRTRFSLYLSAHLMYGAISIWRKQVHILFSDVQDIKVRVGAEMASLEAINLKSTGKHDQVTLPDAVPRTGKEDPFFGTFKHFMDEQFETTSSSISLSDHEALRNVLGSPHTVSSKDEITMKELISTSPLKEIEIPGEAELPELNEKELELISPKAEDVEMFAMQDQEKQPSPADEKTPAKPTIPAAGRDRGAKRKRKHKTDDVDRTQVEQVPSPPKRLSPLQELLPTKQPIRRRHRRELFVDIVKQLSKDDLRFNLSTSETTCKHFVIPSAKPITPAQLFKRPGSKDLATGCNPALRRLWERNCKTYLNVETDTEVYVLAPIWIMSESDQEGARTEGEDRSTEEGSSQDERGQTVAPVMEPLDDIPMDVREATVDEPSVELARNVTTSLKTSPQHSSLHISLGRSPLDEASISKTSSRRTRSHQRSGTDDELSASGLDRSTSLAEEPAPMDMSAQLDVLLEEIEELPTAPIASELEEIPALKIFSPERRFIRRCESECGEDRWTKFKHVCPTTMKRPQAAKCFMTLLVQCKDESLFTRQFRPYADIYISISKENLPISSP